MNLGLKNQPQGFYLLIGSGRLATHLAHYFSQLKIQFQTWNRSESQELLQNYLSESPVVLLAISDSSLEPFYQENLVGRKLTVVHFSGSLQIDQMICCHPLMTFGKSLYPQEAYEKIYFAVNGIECLQDIFPELPNKSFKLKSQDKPLYHALCVLTAAGAQKLWMQTEDLLLDLGVPHEALYPYIKQISENYLQSGSKALTGPWIRKDQKTISQNLNALKSRSPSLYQIYEILKEGQNDNS